MTRFFLDSLSFTRPLAIFMLCDKGGDIALTPNTMSINILRFDNPFINLLRTMCVYLNSADATTITHEGAKVKPSSLFWRTENCRSEGKSVQFFTCSWFEDGLSPILICYHPLHYYIIHYPCKTSINILILSSIQMTATSTLATSTLPPLTDIQISQ